MSGMYCRIPDEHFDPTYCAEEGFWDDTEGGSCNCGSGCKYHIDHGKIKEPIKESIKQPEIRSKKLLDSLTTYCYNNPQLRFWQAVRNWVGWGFVYVSKIPLYDVSVCKGFVDDTFYWEANKEEK